MKKKIAVANVGTEELYRLGLKNKVRETGRLIARGLFPLAGGQSGKTDSKMIKDLFVMAPVGQTMAPNLGYINKTASVDSFFDRIDTLTPAQIRYPELLKVSAPADTTMTLKRKASTIPTRSILSGGNA